MNQCPLSVVMGCTAYRYFYCSVLYINAAPYDKEVSFVNPPSFNVQCAVCFEIFDDPYQTSCCGNHICNDCNKNLKKSRTNNCPYCRKNDFSVVPDKFFSRQVQSLRVVCHNSKRGCPWTGELRVLNKHIEETCEKNFAQCNHCSFRCPHKAFPDHMHMCAEFPLPCPNNCANKTVKRGDLKQHLEQECSLRVVEGGAIPHTANRQVQKIPLAVTMTEFSHYARTGQTWYSPPFFTRKNGYKLCLRVDANWYQKGYVSVLVCVLKGEHDKALAWPLHAKIEVALYNWKTNKPLYNKILHLPGDTFCSANTTNMPAPWGKGLVEYISHSDLAKYIQHDLLNFQIQKVTFRKAPEIPRLPDWADDKCFVVPYFQYMKQHNIIFYGPKIDINSNEGIYKLCSRVDPNGYTKGKGSHVSVSCTLMKGEHDNALSWPIEADIAVELLNWKENKNHKEHTISLSYGACAEAASLVPISGVAAKCFGMSTLAAHSSLSHNATTNTQYLDQNCLLFKVNSFTLYSDRVSARRLPPWVNAAEGSPSHCFTLSEFAKRKEFNNNYYSNPFFSHRNGYKMQILVCAAKGQNVGLYLYLLKGPNDDQLQWPFQGDVVIELVNWRNDKGHHSKVISLSSNCTCNRVMTGDRGSDGWGNAEFISHHALPYNPSTGTEYLQNDCLHFRVKEVAVFSSPTLHRVPAWQIRPPYFQFTVNNFTRRKSLKNQYYSPAFYTHRGGYKMRLEVKVNQQTISLYARLLKGENDAALSWPLTADICVELLNWRNDRNHHTYIISFHERVTAEFNSRVEVSNSATNSWGTHSFISCSSLGYNNSEYINGDCLCFRVNKIAAYSSPLTGKVPQWQPRDQPASFTITHVAQRRNMENTYYSPPFYAAKYKMCLQIHVGGYDSQRGKNVSVFACLLKGEHDDILEWPFRGDITVEVLNWRGDCNHFKCILLLDEYDSYTSRVMTEEIKPGSFGKSAFMPISKSNSYLEEQCMRVRVRSVVSYNGPLRSKTPSWQDSVWHGMWNLTSSDPLIEFTVTGFSSRLANETRYYSEPFYTHNNGYKMRLEVDAEGTGEGSGHMSLYARLMAGEYDSSLKWPMKVDLTVEMVNWASNSSHILKIIDFGDTNRQCCMQVSEEDKIISPLNWGFHQFCYHKKIFDKSRNIEYVQENCVRIRVKGAIIHSKKFLGLF